MCINIFYRTTSPYFWSGLFFGLYVVKPNFGFQILNLIFSTQTRCSTIDMFGPVMRIREVRMLGSEYFILWDGSKFQCPNLFGTPNSLYFTLSYISDRVTERTPLGSHPVYVPKIPLLNKPFNKVLRDRLLYSLRFFFQLIPRSISFNGDTLWPQIRKTIWDSLLHVM